MVQGRSSLTPMLTVKNAVTAVDFYVAAFGAIEQERFTAPTGHVVAELSIDALRFFVVDENPDAFNLSPASLGGTTVRMNLIVDDPDAAAAKAIAAGATEIFPVGDQPYGFRQGRVADPDGHHWLIGKPLPGTTAGTSAWELRESLETEGGTVRFDRFGTGPPLVLLHGTPFSSVVWREIVDRLQRDWTVFVWDMLGYGSSEQSDGQDVSIAAQTRIFGQLLDHWSIESPTVVAHDFGGAIALRAHLLDHRRYRALALLDPVALSPWGSPFFRLVREHTDVFEQLPDYIHRAIVAAYIGNATHKPLADDVLAALIGPWLGDGGTRAFYRQIAQADQRYTDEVQPLYGEIEIPVLILWGEEDRWIDVSRAEELCRLIPDSQMVVVPHAGHLLQEDAPSETAAHISRFLAETYAVE